MTDEHQHAWHQTKQTVEVIFQLQQDELSNMWCRADLLGHLVEDEM